MLPVYTDKDTTKFIEDQKTQQYCDLRHALQVMGKIPSPVVPHTLEQVCVAFNVYLREEAMKFVSLSQRLSVYVYSIP